MFVAFDRRVRVHLGVVTLGAPDRLGACLEALVRHESRHDFVVSLLVNPVAVSGEPAPPGVPPGIRVETAGSNLGWAGGLQRLRALSDAELFVWVQDDMRPQPGWLDALVEAAESFPTVGMFGSVGLDETGTVVDGDQLMAVIADSWAADGMLRGGGVVATVMSNLGLERYLKGRGLDLHRTKVGDRYVVEQMRKGDFNVGGEQSGHIVLSDFGTTGDGLVAALQILACVKRQGKTVSEVCHRFDPVPQILKNVRISTGSPLEDVTVRQAIADAESELAKSGRLLIRPSGTEPLIRVMAEGDDRAQVERIVDELIGVIGGVRNVA